MKFEQIISILDHITGKLDRGLSLFTISLLGIIAVVVNLGVFYRHVLSAGLPWSEEVPKLGMVWMGYMGTSMALRRDQHIGFYALIKKLPAKMQIIFRLIGHFLVLSFLILLIKWGFFLAFTVGSHSVTPEMNISYFWLLMVVPIAGIFMALQLFMKFLKNISDLVEALTGGRQSTETP